MQMNRQRFTKRPMNDCCHNLLLAVLPQKFGESRLRNGEMFGAQTLSNLFIVAERARIVAAGNVTHEILNFLFFHVLLGVLLVLFFVVTPPFAP
jgi:hypothetical protein